MNLSHGQVCYLQIPAIDTEASAAFYERVFNWKIERPYASFEAPGMIGQWTTKRPPARDAGPLLWISVESIDDTLTLVETSGGETLEPPSRDGSRRLATIRDPAGNAVGIVQHGPR